MRKLLLLCALLALAATTYAQTEAPPLDETWNGRGRLADITFDYPTDWFTVGGIPINRFISFNVVSSVRVGLRNPLPEDEEAIVLAVSGGYIDRWPEMSQEDTPEEILSAFLERLGDDDTFSSEQPEGVDEAAAFEVLTEERTFNGYAAVQLRFVPVEGAPTPTPDPDPDPDAAPFEGEFAAYALRLDDNRFVVVLALISQLPPEEARPTVDAILQSFTFDG